MTIREQIIGAVAALADWARLTKGRVFPANDVVSVLEELRQVPGAPAAGVLFWTEDPVSDYPELGKVLRGYKVVVSRGQGFVLQSGESLTQGAGGGPAMFDLVEGARSAVLAMREMGEDGELRLPVYQGTGPFEVQGMVLDAYEIRFGLYAQINREDEPLEEIVDE